jgi:superfamily II DNA or RNA helicase
MSTKESSEELFPGLYDQPVTVGIARALSALPDGMRAEVEGLDPHEAPEAIARQLHRRLVHALGSFGGSREDRLAAQVVLANRLLEMVRGEATGGGAEPQDDLEPPARRLLSLIAPADGTLGRRGNPIRPEIPLATSDLLVNGRHDLSIGPEVIRELASADRVDLLCSFLKWSGFRVLRDALRELLDRRPGGLRVLTTAYMGATERRAIDELARMGASIRVSYDTARTRLHAKAWLFHRNTGFSTAFIGSSNLSAPAMLDGLEWNVRLSQVDNRSILEKFKATFEQYWEDVEFCPYDPERDAGTYDAAIERQRSSSGTAGLRAAFDIQPLPHQQMILEHLDAERGRGHHRNLVVAATGTGKTVVAALDYRRIMKHRGRATLLFVAHRREILEQSLDTFRVVLRDGSFGELLHADATPKDGRHVFANVQSLHAGRLAELAPDAYEVVIVDEFHHAAAPTYERLLRHLRPQLLLGLTATPERTDGQSVLGWFDGRVASELRLWQALDQGLLCPFQYFGVSGPDLSTVPWTRGRYDVTNVSNVYTADDLFVKRILQEVHDKVGDPSEMRALGFCVDVAHARFMADRFCRAGIAAAEVSATSSQAERDNALRALRNGSLRVLFSVDLFNEGLDVPDVNTVIFLRPTESATLFLQQLGRGLRRSEDKPCCTVLDFIGGAHRQFRFDRRFRAIVGGTRREIEHQIERGFPSLPAGCAIHLTREAQQAVLDNVRYALRLGHKALAEDLREVVREHGRVDLGTFLDKASVDLEDVYPGEGRCWTALQRQAGLEVPPPGPDDRQIERALCRMIHLNDASRIDGLKRLLQTDAPPDAAPDDLDQRRLLVLLGHVRMPYRDMRQAWANLWPSPLRQELLELLDVLADRIRSLSWPLDGALAALPLLVHGRYSLDEVLVSVDERSSKGGLKRIQTGVHYVERYRADLLFITLEKSERDYTPTTLYNDYALSDRRFHWETQSNCHVGTPTGHRYLEAVEGAPNHVLMFVRQRRHDSRGETMPYLFLGPAYYRTHRGARPMQIEFSLKHPMPAEFYQEVKVAAG